MIKAVLLFGLLALPLTTVGYAADIAASTCSNSDVQAAINTAVNGDRVLVPAGTCAWSTAVTIPNTKGITLEGSGEGVTVIQSHASVTGSASLGITTAAGNSVSRVTAMTFDFNGVAKSTSSIGMVHVTGDGVNSYRLDHLTFLEALGRSIIVGVDLAGSTKVNGANNWSGLVDHVTITVPGTGVVQGLSIFGSGPESDATYTRSVSLGSNGLHYIEDSTFNFPDDANDGVVDAYGGARYVFRNNIVHGTLIGHHGADSGGYRGPSQIELYRNTFDCIGHSCSRMIFWRSGTGVIFDHTFTGSFNQIIGASVYRHADNPNAPFSAKYGTCDGSSTWDGNAGVPARPGWPCLDQTGYMFTSSAGGTYTAVPTYVWKNTEDGIEIGMAGDGWGASYFAADREFYNYTSSFDGTTGVGQGTLANRPSTCTTGVAYWATDQGTWNKIPGGQQGVLYKCTATDTWTLYYTPYEYPHPLQGYITTRPRFAPALNLRVAQVDP